MNESNQRAVDALRAYFRKENDNTENDFYFSSSTDFVDGRVDLRAIVSVVRDALRPQDRGAQASPPPSAKTEAAAK